VYHFYLSSTYEKKDANFALWSWLASLGMRISSSTHSPAKGKITFFFMFE
jgi:hypothetical protein